MLSENVWSINVWGHLFHERTLTTNTGPAEECGLNMLLSGAFLFVMV